MLLLPGPALEVFYEVLVPLTAEQGFRIIVRNAMGSFGRPQNHRATPKA